MPLLDGAGDGTDQQGEYVVYVHDSNRFPFFRAEAYHQFHTNDVVGRPVPASYTSVAKQVQTDLGRLDSTGCIDFAYLGTVRSGKAPHKSCCASLIVSRAQQEAHRGWRVVQVSALCFGLVLGGGSYVGVVLSGPCLREAVAGWKRGQQAERRAAGGRPTGA